MTVTIENVQNRSRGRIGMIVPSSNTNLEPDCGLLAPEGVTMHFTRVGGYDVDDIPDEEVQRNFALESIDETLELLMAADVKLIAYGCTSATLAHGPEFDRQFQQQLSENTGIPTVTAAGAILEALQELDISRIGFTSPYVAALNEEAIDFIDASGVRVVNHAGTPRDLNSREQGMLTPHDAYKLGCQADHPDAEAIVISCTEFRALEAVTALERDLGKPVITSNQALMYASLVRLGLGEGTSEMNLADIKIGGRLFTEHTDRANNT